MTWGCEWHHATEARAEDFGNFEESQLSWELDSEREGSTFGARWDQTNLRVTGATRDGGGRWKSQNRKNVYLSPYVEEPLNSKVIKSFVPELRSRKCFSCFGIPMFYAYMLWTFYVRFTHIRIWLWYKKSSRVFESPLTKRRGIVRFQLPTLSSKINSNFLKCQWN